MPRSTRKQIRIQISKAAQRMDDAAYHLMYADKLAAGRSKTLNERLALLLDMLEQAKKVFTKFRSEL